MQTEFTQGAWLAIQVKPRHEYSAARILHEKGYRELVPTYVSRRRWSDREKNIETPLFPGYVFCCLEGPVQGLLLTTPGVCRIVGKVEPEEIDALQRVVASREAAHPWPYLEAGVKVCLQAGPLAGVEGIITDAKDARRFVISVTLLRRALAIEVDPRWLAPAV